MQDLIRGWERQGIFIDNGCTSDSGVATLTPTDTISKLRSPASPNIFELLVDCYGSDYPVIEDDNDEEIDVDKNDDDDSDEDFVDDRNKEHVQPVRLPQEQERDHQAPPEQLRKNNGVPFGRLEKISQSVIRSLFE